MVGKEGWDGWSGYSLSGSDCDTFNLVFIYMLLIIEISYLYHLLFIIPYLGSLRSKSYGDRKGGCCENRTIIWSGNFLR